MENVDLGTALLWFTSFLFSTTVHEAMHAYVAWKGGDPTAYLGGQVSLSPIPHMRREPIGMLVLPLVTALTQGWVVGWASAPYDPHWAARYPRRAAVMAAAGPAGNFMIAIAAFGLMKIGLAAGWFTAPDTANFESIVGSTVEGYGFVATFLSILLVQNVFLGVFNLLPLPPLDGAAVFSLLLPPRAADSLRDLTANGMMSMVGLLVAWRVFPMFTGPLFSFLLALVHPGVSYS